MTDHSPAVQALVAQCDYYVSEIERLMKERDGWFNLLAMLLWQDGQRHISAATQIQVPNGLVIESSQDPITMDLVLRARHNGKP
jgi:hypothetical protein